MSSFDVPSKWILAGEHAVLRGRRAVALPYRERQLHLHFEKHGTALQVDPIESHHVLDRMLEILKKHVTPFPKLHGHLKVRSTIPEGSGLGSSAGVSVAVTRWVLSEAGEKPDPIRVRELATELEDLFHGKSSGLDVAVVSANEPIEFQKGKVTLLGVRELPKFTLHDTGLRCSTKECVDHVRRLLEADPAQGEKWDLQMDEAAQRARDGLESGDLLKLTKSIQMAQDCFEKWGLVPDSVRDLLTKLKDQGALAAKLTGAGRGGYVVALWP